MQHTHRRQCSRHSASDCARMQMPTSICSTIKCCLVTRFQPKEWNTKPEIARRSVQIKSNHWGDFLLLFGVTAKKPPAKHLVWHVSADTEQHVLSMCNASNVNACVSTTIFFLLACTLAFIFYNDSCQTRSILQQDQHAQRHFST